jgi:penicillin-binding protein 2
MVGAVEAGTVMGLARIKNITIAGKTGTSQNKKGPDHSIFIAFAPVDNPKIAIAVFVENGRWGGTAAAPVANLIIERFIKGKTENKALENYVLNLKLMSPLSAPAPKKAPAKAPAKKEEITTPLADKKSGETTKEKQTTTSTGK